MFVIIRTILYQNPGLSLHITCRKLADTFQKFDGWNAILYFDFYAMVSGNWYSRACLVSGQGSKLQQLSEHFYIITNNKIGHLAGNSDNC